MANVDASSSDGFIVFELGWIRRRLRATLDHCELVDEAVFLPSVYS
jgi:hypothetical protein